MFLLQLQQHKQHYIYWLVSFLWPYSVVIDERRFRQFLAVTSRKWQDGGFSGWRGKMNGAKSLTQCLRPPCLAYCTQSRSLKTPNTSRLEQRDAGDTLFPLKLSGNHTSAKTGPISKHLRIAGFGWLWIWMACKGGWSEWLGSEQNSIILLRKLHCVLRPSLHHKFPGSMLPQIWSMDRLWSLWTNVSSCT